jgi:NAD(P)-dependent dehydrogenase (short-subunit alcohol dehydrogenase family)
MSSLRDRVAIVTGGAQGIGRHIAEKLHAEGATVVIADMQAAQGVAEALDGLAVEVDVSDPGACERMSAAAIDGYGRIDILVNNAAPEDIVGAVAFFAGDGAAFITGQSLVVDGGAYFN